MGQFLSSSRWFREDPGEEPWAFYNLLDLSCLNIGEREGEGRTGTSLSLVYGKRGGSIFNSER